MKKTISTIFRRSGKVVYWAATRQLTARYRMWRDWQNRVELERAYDRWVKQCDTPLASDLTQMRMAAAELKIRPLISVVMPTYNSPVEFLTQAIESVRAQIYENWELCIADDASPDPAVVETIRRFADLDPRIKWMVRPQNGNIAHASNSALELATGDYVALLDHDDFLPPYALYKVAREIDADPSLNVLYSDEDQIDESGRRHNPYFKPAYNLDVLLGHNLVSHLGVYRRTLLTEIGGFRPGYEGSQDYDLALRSVIASAPGTIRHIPAVLYHWRRMEGGSFSQEQLDRCIDAARRAVRDHMATLLGPEAAVRVTENPSLPDWTRVHWPLPDPQPTVSIIIPTRDRADLLRTCVDGLLKRTNYECFEVIIIDNDSVEPETEALFAELRSDRRIRILGQSGPFNFSAFNNFAVAQSSADVVLFLNNDVDVIEPDWLREMVSHAVRPDVGAVGAKLLYADGTVQHAGVLLGAGALPRKTGVAGHFGYMRVARDVGYYGQFVMTRELSAVTAACLAMRRSVFNQVDGLDATNLKIAYNDVDLCLRIREAGYRVVWTPFALLHHYESQTRGEDLKGEKAQRFERERQYMIGRWGDLLQTDPFYNTVFLRGYNDFRLDFSRSSKRWWRLR